MTDLDEIKCYNVVLKLVKEAGEVVKEAYNRPCRIETLTKSSDIDLVTETDKKVEQLLVDGLKIEFPGHLFIGEESAVPDVKPVLTDGPTWIIDPIDGTTNFVHKLPFIGICIALYVKKQPRIGIVFNPILNELYTARRGQGAYKNGFSIRVSGTEDLKKSLICLTIKSQPSLLNLSVRTNKALIESGIRGERSLGSAAINMCSVANGGCDAYMEYGVCCWDYAAAGLIVEEAGGFICDVDGTTPHDVMCGRILCASSEKLARSIAAVCKASESKV